MSDDIFRYVILEIRPRLQCVNGFIGLASNYESVEIDLDDEKVLVVLGNRVNKIPCSGIKIVRNSLSSVKIADKSISFRFLTNNSLEKIGSFKAEFLQNTVASIESLSNKPLLSKSTRYILRCINCKKALTGSLQFSRILPLPSESSDSNDWFCHDHGNKTDFDLDPKESDVFYSQCFVHLNANAVNNLKISSKVLVCKFCLQWLGVKHNNSTIKLWFNTVSFSSDGDPVHSSSLNDAFQTIKNCLKYSIHSSSKLVITCQTTPGSSDVLLLWVLEKKLQILFGGNEVKGHDVAKVLFKFVRKNDPLIGQWENDSLVSCVDMSKPMMVDLLTKLHEYNKLFPLEYSKSNDFKVSYLFLYDGL